MIDSGNKFAYTGRTLYGPNTFRGILALIWYGVTYQGRGGKRRIPVDVKKMIDDWTKWIVVYSTAHDKKDIDETEFRIDELLTPLLTAPIKQLREFWNGLVKAVESEQRIPYTVVAMFKAYNTIEIKEATNDDRIKRLKVKLAGEIAEMVEQSETIQIDLEKALIGALKWRSPENLEEIKNDLEAGAKPRLQGRQSCLFLTTKKRGRNQKEHSVML